MKTTSFLFFAPTYLKYSLSPRLQSSRVSISLSSPTSHCSLLSPPLFQNVKPSQISLLSPPPPQKFYCSLLLHPKSSLLAGLSLSDSPCRSSIFIPSVKTVFLLCFQSIGEKIFLVSPPPPENPVARRLFILVISVHSIGQDCVDALFQ